MTMQNNERNDLILKLYKEKPHLSNNDIAKEVGCTRAIVSGVLFREREKGTISRHGLRRSPRRRVQATGSLKRIATQGSLAVEKRADPLPSASPERSKELIKAVTSLRVHQCRWPLEVNGHFRFCPERKRGESYCEYHERVARYGTERVERNAGK